MFQWAIFTTMKEYLLQIFWGQHVWSSGMSKATSANRWHSKLWISEQLYSTGIMVSLSTHFCIQHPLKEVLQISPTAWGAPELSVQARSGQQKTEFLLNSNFDHHFFHSGCGSMKHKNPRVLKAWFCPSPHKKANEAIVLWLNLYRKARHSTPSRRSRPPICFVCFMLSDCKASHLKSQSNPLFLKLWSEKNLLLYFTNVKTIINLQCYNSLI